MKLINPFDRLKKRNNVPLSLFPASKKTATTMPVGRAVPLYCIDMIQGNRLKLSVEQLTRFMEMNGPLMQNYEVTFGAYFVPYVALDHFFDSAWFQKSNVIDSVNCQYVLSARDFFNPATLDSLRVAVRKMNVKAQGVTGNGSLWQHLGYPYAKMLTDMTYDGTGEDGSAFTSVSVDALYTNENYAFGEEIHETDEEGGDWVTSFSAYLVRLITVKYPDASTDDLVKFIKHHFFNSSDVAPVWDTYLQGLTLTSIYMSYVQYLNAYHNDLLPYSAFPTYNMYRWLAYMRIYSDWYLNPIYTACEDFRDMIGCGYLGYTDNPATSSSSFKNAFTTTYNAKLKDDPTLDFFASFIRSGECLPVLWKKDQLTSIVQTDAASSVAIGDTIGENFYNRMYAKFKDLVARMGRDYRANTAALYGHKVGDNSLQRSQVIGYKSFDIKVGEIAQTSKSDKDSNLGSFAGYALSRDNAGLFDWTAEENGIVMVIAYVRPQYVAIAGQVDKSVYKYDYLDYLIPEFGGVGYQSVEARRFDFTQDASVTLGLEERYSEYMSVPNEVSGDMLDVYSYLTSDRLFPQLYQFGTADYYKNLYMWDKESLHRVFQNTLFDPVALVAFFDGTVTRQLPATIRTDF